MLRSDSFDKYISVIIMHIQYPPKVMGQSVKMTKPWYLPNRGHYMLPKKLKSWKAFKELLEGAVMHIFTVSLVLSILMYTI